MTSDIQPPAPAQTVPETVPDTMSGPEPETPGPVGEFGPPLRIGAVSIDCADAAELADFYCALLGMTRIVEAPDGSIVAVSDGTYVLALMRVPDYQPPTWPETDRPKQFHLDIPAADLDAGGAKAVAAGARLAAHQPAPDEWRVFLDPAGHPFCLTVHGVT